MDDGIKIKITAEDDASAAFEKVRANIIGSFRDIDEAGGVITALTDGLGELGSEFISGGQAANVFSRGMDKAQDSAAGLGAELAAMVSGLKDFTSAGMSAVQSSWFRSLFVQGSGGAIARLLAGGAGNLTGIGLGAAALYGGVKWSERSNNEQQRRDALAPAGLPQRQWREMVEGARAELGNRSVNRILNDPLLTRLREVQGGGQVYRDEVSKRIVDKQNRRAAADENARAQQEMARNAATEQRMAQARYQAKDQLGVAERMYAEDPLKLIEMQLRADNAGEEYIKFRVQQERDLLKIEQDKSNELEKQHALAEKRADIDRRMGSQAEGWIERSRTDQEKRQRDELEVLGLMMSGRIGHGQFQRIMDSIAIEYTKPDDKKAKRPLELPGGNLYESASYTRGGGRSTEQVDLLKKLIAELANGNRAQRIEAAKIETAIKNGQPVGKVKVNS